MTTNHSKRPQTPPVSLGEIGRGEGSSTKVVSGDLPTGLSRLTVRPAAGGEYAPIVAAFGGGPVDIIELSAGLDPVRIGEVR